MTSITGLVLLITLLAYLDSLKNPHISTQQIEHYAIPCPSCSVRQSSPRSPDLRLER